MRTLEEVIIEIRDINDQFIKNGKERQSLIDKMPDKKTLDFEKWCEEWKRNGEEFWEFMNRYTELEKEFQSII